MFFIITRHKSQKKEDFNKNIHITHDYTHKGGVVHTEILLQDHAPAEYVDRTDLWSEVEKIENAKNAQLTWEIEIALPRELTREQSISLVC